ncbi:hypothetical protein EP355_09110, partial [Campylobacter coli]|nr:hypothetical protein [Campylobacter coli]
MKKPRNFHYLVNIYFTIKKFKKGLKLHFLYFQKVIYFTIKKFKKGLKLPFFPHIQALYFTIKK